MFCVTVKDVDRRVHPVCDFTVTLCIPAVSGMVFVMRRHCWLGTADMTLLLCQLYLQSTKCRQSFACSALCPQAGQLTRPHCAGNIRILICSPVHPPAFNNYPQCIFIWKCILIGRKLRNLRLSPRDHIAARLTQIWSPGRQRHSRGIEGIEV